MASKNGNAYRKAGLYSPNRPNKRTYQKEFLNYLKGLNQKAGGKLKKATAGNMEINMRLRDRYNSYLKSRAQETNARDKNRSGINRLQSRIQLRSKAKAPNKRVSNIVNKLKGMNAQKRKEYLMLLKKRTNPKSYIRNFRKKSLSSK